ncbi:MAG: YfhO family protein, partial [Anaerolineales bacterium]
SISARLLSALAFSLSGYLIGRAGFLSINAAAAWLPWIILGIEGLVDSCRSDDGRPNRATLWLVLLLAMQWLAGHAQTAWYTLVLAGLWMIWRTMGLEGGWRNVLRLWFRFSVAGLLAACIAAPQLLPTLEYLANSYRAESLDPTFAMTYSFWPWRLLGLITPDLFGSPVSGDYWGYGNYWEDAIYIGVLPLLMLGIALRRLRGTDRRAWSLVKFLALVSAGALILALGDNTPVFPFLFRHVPSFDLFQAPTRWTLLLVFALSMMAGFGFDAWRPPEGRLLYWTHLLTAGAGVIGLAAWIGSAVLLETQPTFVRAFSLAGLWLFLAGVLALIKDRLSADVWNASALVVLLIDLVVAGWGLNPSVPTRVYETKMATYPGSMQRYYLPADLEYSLTYEQYFTFDSFQSQHSWADVLEMGIPNTNALAGVSSVNNFDPIRPERTERWVDALEGSPAETRDVYLRAANVALTADHVADGEVQYRPIPTPQRAYLVPEAIPVAGLDDALERVFQPDFDPQQQVVIEGEIHSQQLSTIIQLESIQIEPTTNPNRLSLDIVSSSGGWLVLADSWYPGWSAAIDGADTPIYPANGVFRAVWLPPGEHTLTFLYAPVSLKIGAALFVAAMLALAGLRLSWKRT